MTANVGFWRSTARRASAYALLLGASAFLPAAAFARDVIFALPAGTLDTALMSVARASNTEIISTEPGLHFVHTPAVRGTMSPRRALDVLLADTGYRAVAIARGYRIVRAGAVRKPPGRPPPSAALPPTPLPADRGGDIIVTGSKQRTPLLRYPGSVTIIVGSRDLTASGSGDLSDLTRVAPVLESTQLGAGRNKVFIRGIADSSFNGATQSTASTYLDDVQLNYSGSDPGLRLYDMAAIDVMEGPQGTLYGAGAIGGVVRLTSNAPDLAASHAALAAGATATRDGEPGFDVSGLANVPIRSGVAALRMVGYRVRDGGYIDDHGRGLVDINRTDTVGGRAALRVDPGDQWRIELSAAAQTIDARDGQYAEAGNGPLARSSLLAQPFHSRLHFGRLLVSKDWDSGLHLVVASGIALADSTEIFDATASALPAPPGLGMPPPPSVPLRYDTTNAKRLLTQETRVSRTRETGGSWVAGFTVLSNRDVLSRSTGVPGSEVDIIGVTNITQAGSAFGEATFALRRNFAVTVGARGTIARIDGEPSTQPRAGSFVKGRLTTRFDPTVALSWTFAPRMAAFARYQTGYRTGGLAVARGVGRVADYRADSITVGEVGLRRLRSQATGVSFSASASIAHWTGIQADLLNRRGASYTLNLGDARIVTLEGSAEWVPLPGLGVNAAFLYTENDVTGPVADLSARDNRRLPETPPFAAQGAVNYRWAAGRAMTLHAGGTASYVGRSVLGVGDLLDNSQGRYVLLGMSGGAKWRSVDLSLVLDNLTNTAANRFAYGNPFALAARDERTPPRPFNARVGISVAL